MTTLVARRMHVPLWLRLLAAGVAWLGAWFLNLPLANWASYQALRLDRGSQLGEAVAFFLYDVPKVLLLLLEIVTVVRQLTIRAVKNEARPRWPGFDPPRLAQQQPEPPQQEFEAMTGRPVADVDRVFDGVGSLTSCMSSTVQSAGLVARTMAL